MATACNRQFSDEDLESLSDTLDVGDSLEKYRSDLEKTREESVLRCLNENGRNSQDAQHSQHQNTDSADIKTLDRELSAGEKEYKTMFRTGRELGMSQAQIINSPQILGTSGVKDIDTKIQDVMNQLHTSRIPPQYREEYVVIETRISNGYPFNNPLYYGACDPMEPLNS